MTQPPSPTQEPLPPNLLADLESRQDELLRLLAELEERTKQALASLTAPAKPLAVEVSTTIAAPALGAGSAVGRNEGEPSARTDEIVAGSPGNSSTNSVEKPVRAATRTRSRKAA